MTPMSVVHPDADVARPQGFVPRLRQWIELGDRTVRSVVLVEPAGARFATARSADGRALDARPGEVVRVVADRSIRVGRVVRSGPHLVLDLTPARERRTDRRIAVFRTVRWHTARGGGVGRTEDLGLGGLRLLVDAPVAADTDIDVEVALGRGEHALLHGEVLECAPIGNLHRVRIALDVDDVPLAASILRRAGAAEPSDDAAT